MRVLLLALLCALGLVACAPIERAPSIPAAQPTELPTPIAEVVAETGVPVELFDTLRIDTYAVGGRSAAEIRADLNRAGPISIENGRRFDGLTSWSLKWTLHYRKVETGCALSGATINLDMVILLPELTLSPELPARTAQTWQTYRENLRLHEMGHVENQRREAYALQSIFTNYDGVWPTCRDLGNALKVEGDLKVNAIFAADRIYDESTGHGRDQGAAFP